MTDKPGLDMSFSGLKTHTRNLINEQDIKIPKVKHDICAGFQEAVIDTLITKCKRAIEQTGLNSLVIAGGVSANHRLRKKMDDTLKQIGINVFYSRLEFCTDNGAMIAYAGHARLSNGERSTMAIETRPRWPLDTLQEIK